METLLRTSWGLLVAKMHIFDCTSVLQRCQLTSCACVLCKRTVASDLFALMHLQARGVVDHVGWKGSSYTAFTVLAMTLMIFGVRILIGAGADGIIGMRAWVSCCCDGHALLH
jgi:hypothetical protein